MTWLKHSIVVLGSFLMSTPLLAGTGEFVRVAQTAHISFYARDGAGTSVDPGRNERYLLQVAAELGIELSEKDQIVYYRHQYPEEVAFFSGMRGGQYAGVATDDRIDSTLAFHRHEIAHVVAFRLGDPGRFFQEGLAVALADKGRWGSQDVERLARRYSRTLRPEAVASVLQFHGLEDESVAYVLAGAFARHLIKQRGFATFVRFFRECGQNSQHRDGAFTSVYGESLDGAFARWRANL